MSKGCDTAEREFRWNCKVGIAQLSICQCQCQSPCGIDLASIERKRQKKSKQNRSRFRFSGALGELPELWVLSKTKETAEVAENASRRVAYLKFSSVTHEVRPATRDTPFFHRIVGVFLSASRNFRKPTIPRSMSHCAADRI